MKYLSIRLMLLTLSVCIMSLPQRGFAYELTLSPDFPTELRDCFGNSIAELLATDRNDVPAVRSLFYSHIEPNLLGARAFGGNTWKNASDTWRDAALNMYFELVFGSGSKTVVTMDAATVVINARLAKNPDVHKPNQWHIVVDIDNVGAAVLMTNNCRAFDFAQGDWASNHIDANEVDLVVPAKDRRRK